MRKLEYQIQEEQAGMTVEHFLKKCHGYSSRTIIKLKHYPEGMQCNGVHVRTIDHLHPGDILTITFLDGKEHGIENFIRSNRRVEIVYEDKDIVIFNKPPDMPCHQSCGHAADTLANVFATHCDRLGVSLMYRSLNRLDRDTSGAVVVAKNRYAAASITGNFHKVYRAILNGIPPELSGKIDAPIRRESLEEIRRIVAEDGQRAITNYRVVAQGNGCCLCDFVLETGRTHQIRVHMAHIGCPVFGDPMYGEVSELISRQALHCLEVEMNQPVTGEKIHAICPEPEDILKVRKELGL